MATQQDYIPQPGNSAAANQMLQFLLSASQGQGPSGADPNYQTQEEALTNQSSAAAQQNMQHFQQMGAEQMAANAANSQNQQPQHFGSGILKSLLTHAGGQLINDYFDTKQGEAKQALADKNNQATRANLEQLRVKYPEMGKAIDLLLTGNKDLSQAGGNIVEQMGKPKGAVNPWVGGVKGNANLRQNYTTDDSGKVIPLAEPYAAFQERDAPLTFGSVQTADANHPSLPEGSQYQTDSRGGLHVIHVAPEKFDVHQDPETGAVVSVNKTTGKTTIDNATEGQTKAASALNRAQVINSQYENLIHPKDAKGNPLPGFDPTALDKSNMSGKLGEVFFNSENPLVSSIGGALMPDNQRAYKDIRDSWNEAFLRDESGAAINRSEWAQKDRQNWPMPGDSKAEVTRKSERRAALEKGVAGRTATHINGGGSTQQHSQSPQTPNAPLNPTDFPTYQDYLKKAVGQ